MEIHIHTKDQSHTNSVELECNKQKSVRKCVWFNKQTFKKFQSHKEKLIAETVSHYFFYFFCFCFFGFVCQKAPYTHGNTHGKEKDRSTEKKSNKILFGLQ